MVRPYMVLCGVLAAVGCSPRAVNKDGRACDEGRCLAGYVCNDEGVCVPRIRSGDDLAGAGDPTEVGGDDVRGSGDDVGDPGGDAPIPDGSPPGDPAPGDSAGGDNPAGDGLFDDGSPGDAAGGEGDGDGQPGEPAPGDPQSGGDALSPNDSAPSCASVFGAAPGFILCGSSAASCAFNVQTGDYTPNNCEQVCKTFGRECLGAHDNPSGDGAECDVLGVDTCATTRSTEICFCSR